MWALRMLEHPLAQFGDSNVALLPSYSCGKVVIVDQLGRDACMYYPAGETAFNGGVDLSA